MKEIKFFATPVFILILVITLTGCNLVLGEPDFLVHGVVLDSKTGQPICGSIVSDSSYGPDPKKHAVTDSQGKYSYFTWYEEHTIVAESPGYNSQTITLATKIFKKEDNREINFSLIPE